MSVVGLGDKAKVGVLDANEVSASKEQIKFRSQISAAGALPVTGAFFVAPPANPTAYTLGEGVNSGDVIKIIHRGGGNVANIAVPTLHGGANSISMPDGSSVELVWSALGEWYMTGRDSNAAATGAVVAGLPTVA